MRAGPKKSVRTDPLDLSDLPVMDPALRRIRFVERYLVTPSGTGALRPFRFRPWQVEIVERLYAPGVRTGLVSLPRGNGKTQLAAVLATASLFLDGEQAQVLAVASTEQQARLVFRASCRMIALAPDLADRCKVFRDSVLYEATDSILAPLPATPDALQGYSPSTAIVDELHVVQDETWEAMALAGGKRSQSLILAISTAAGDREGPMWRLTERGRAGDDPSFAFVEYSAPEDAGITDPATWAIANPAMGDFLAEDAIRANLRDARESQFRRYRLNQWCGTDRVWVSGQEWDRCQRPGTIKPGAKVVLGFDGSVSNDSTALVMCEISTMRVKVLGLWERPSTLPANDNSWRVPRGEVTATIDRAFREYKVLELAADPYHWRSDIEEWQQSYGQRKVIEFPTASITRMAPASDRVRTLIVDAKLSHDGDKRLGQHITNCVAVETPAGTVVRKDERRKRTRKVDAAMALIISVDRASHHGKRLGGRTAAFNVR